MGGSKDYAQARKWYLKAATQGHARAQLRVGTLYANGEGVPQNYRQARDWWLKAATQGNAGAQLQLGDMYKDGRDQKPDKVLAHMWYNLAAAQGSSFAAKERDQIAKNMDHEQIAEAQRLAHEWKPIRSKVE